MFQVTCIHTDERMNYLNKQKHDIYRVSSIIYFSAFYNGEKLEESNLAMLGLLL